MSKEKERKTARILYVDQGKTNKEISRLVGVTEKTVSQWAQKYGWEEERTARNVTPARRIENIKSIIHSLSEERLEVQRQAQQAEADNDIDTATELRTRIGKIDDSVAKWNKTLSAIQDENKVSLSVYLKVMDQIFEALRIYDNQLYIKTVDFQENHIHKITRELI